LYLVLKAHARGFISGLAQLARELQLLAIKDAFLREREIGELPRWRGVILYEVLREIRSTEAFKLAADMLAAAFDEASVTICFIARFAEPGTELSWDRFSPTHIYRLAAMLSSPSPHCWPVEALKFICAKTF
jgi:hypothetical protein